MRYCFFSLFLLFCACAPRVAAPPPLYGGSELSLQEIIRIAGDKITSMKAIAGISVEKDGRPYSYVDALILLEKPGSLHMRVYTLGLLTGDFLMREGVVRVASGRMAGGFQDFGRELYYAVFWWEDIEGALLYREPEAYVIKTGRGEIRLNPSTLLPESQAIRVNGGTVTVMYEKPAEEAGYWYPSVLKIDSGAYGFTVTVQRLFVNPAHAGGKE